MELKIEHLTKKYKDKTAVDDVSLTITPGIWGLLGANGAGKTTMMRMIAGIMKPTEGCVKYDGIEILKMGEAYRDIFGYLPQDFGFYPEFTVKDYLEYVAALKGLTKHAAREKIGELLRTLTLESVKNKKITKLSGGMKRRVGIAQERIVLISTHIVPDIEYIAYQNAVMKEGRIAATGTTEELVAMMEGKVWEASLHVQEVHRAEQKVRIVNLKNEEYDTVSVRYLSEAHKLPGAVPAKPRLEDLYLWLFPQEDTGKGEVSL